MKKVGKDIDSLIIIANAKDNSSDEFSSVVAMGSIGKAMSITGIRIADAIAGLLVVWMIFTMKVEIIASAVSLLNEKKERENQQKGKYAKN